MKTRTLTFISAAVCLLAACGTNNPDFPGDWPTGDNPGSLPGTGTGTDNTEAPTFDSTIYPYDGQTAADASADVVGTDADLYHELNDFSTKVEITYSGSTATVSTASQAVLYSVDGAHVTVDLLTNSVKNVNLVLKGASDDGSLKVYGEKKTLLTLNGVDLTSKRGPAINNQCKKRMFVQVADGTVNSLADVADYAADNSGEDRKGCFFSEGNLIFSGRGVLKVAGKYRHGIATDGYFYMRPGVTIAVTEAAKNAVHVKGDSGDAIGVVIAGGLLYTNTSSDAGKGIKCDLTVRVAGGQLQLNTSGTAIYNADDADTSSAAGIKADGNIYIEGGTLTLKATGKGGKGISTDSDLFISGGTTTITTTGGKYYYTNSMTSSPKGVKADGNITVSGGDLNISVTGVSDGSEGLESKANLTVSGGNIYVYAYDDAINAGTAYVQTGGRVFCHAVNNDGLDSNGTLSISGGLVIASGTRSPEEAFDADNSQNFTVTGGTLIGIGGNATAPGSRSTQNTLLYGGLTAAKGSNIAVLDSDGNIVVAYKLHRDMSGYALTVSSPGLAKGSYTMNVGGTVDGASGCWNGYYSGGTWSGGSKAGSFTVSSSVTTVGSVSSMGGGNMGGGPGGGPGGWW